MSERHRIIGAAMLILRDGEHVLLSLRKNTGYRDGDYGLVSGHLEQGETFLQGAIREAHEEIGIILRSEDVQFVHASHRSTDGYVYFYFTASHWSGEIQNKEPEKCDDLRWFSLKEIPENTIPYVVDALIAIQESRTYSEQ